MFADCFRLPKYVEAKCLCTESQTLQLNLESDTEEPAVFRVFINEQRVSVRPVIGILHAHETQILRIKLAPLEVRHKIRIQVRVTPLPRDLHTVELEALLNNPKTKQEGRKQLRELEAEYSLGTTTLHSRVVFEDATEPDICAGSVSEGPSQSCTKDTSMHECPNSAPGLTTAPDTMEGSLDSSSELDVPLAPPRSQPEPQITVGCDEDVWQPRSEAELLSSSVPASVAVAPEEPDASLLDELRILRSQLDDIRSAHAAILIRLENYQRRRLPKDPIEPAG